MAEYPIDQNETSENETGEKNLSDTSTESNMEPKISAETGISDNQVPVDSGEHLQQKAAEEGTESGLPVGFTKEPQDKEHMDLRGVEDYEKWADVYRLVSDDEGQLLGDQQLERTVRELCENLEKINLYRAESPELLVEKIKNITFRYAGKLNVAEHITFGITTKYHIRLGLLLLFLQTLVKNRLGLKWMEWFSKNFDQRYFRSAEVYMQIAGVQNSIRYAVFGKERLLQIIRRIDKKNLNKEDPIGDFLRKNNIDFDPKLETEFQEVRVEADVAIEKEKLSKAGITEISSERVEALVRNKRKLTSHHIKQLVLTKEKGDDLEEKMDKIVSGLKFEPLQTRETKATGFVNTADKFLKAIENALADQEYLTKMNLEKFNRLKEKIQELEQIIAKE